MKPIYPSPLPPPPDDKIRDKQLEYCSPEWFQIIYFRIFHSTFTITEKGMNE